MIPKIGPLELIIILVIVTMLFGVGKLPEVFGSVGRGVREFRRASEGDDETSSKPAQANDEISDSSADTAADTTVDTSADTSTDKPAPQT